MGTTRVRDDNDMMGQVKDQAGFDWTEMRRSLVPEKAASVLPPSIKLPVLPKALTEFNEKAGQEDIEVGELSRIISTDSGLSSELLRHVNSAATGVRQPVKSVQQALVTLGIRSTRLHLTTTGMKQVMKSSSSKLINFQNFWNANLERALFAREVATLMNVDADLAFTACMLQDFLLPVITNQLLDEYMEFTENREQYGSIVAFERKIFGWDHAEAAATMMHGWQFPDELVCCVCMHHHNAAKIAIDENLGNSTVAAICFATLIPDALLQEKNGLERLHALDQSWDELDVLALSERVDEDFQATSIDAHNHFPFVRQYKKFVERLEAEADPQ